MAGNIEVIKVKIADCKIAESPKVLVTSGLGSCVGLTLHDKTLSIGGLAHIMLPTGGKKTTEKFYPRYADTAISMMFAELEKMGCHRENIEGKLAGGASMFQNLRNEEKKSIGDRNVEAILNILDNMNIPVVGSDTGGDYGRSVEFHVKTGDFIIKSIRHGNLTI